MKFGLFYVSSLQVNVKYEYSHSSLYLCLSENKNVKNYNKYILK